LLIESVLNNVSEFTFNPVLKRMLGTKEHRLQFRQLLDEGIMAMKGGPTIPLALASDGQYLSPADLDRALRPFREIRDAVGMEMQLANDAHAKWNLPIAIRIAQAMEPLEPMWQEDLTPLLNPEALLRLQEATRTPVCISERLLTRWQLRQYIENGAAVTFAHLQIAGCFRGMYADAATVFASAVTIQNVQYGLTAADQATVEAQSFVMTGILNTGIFSEYSSYIYAAGAQVTGASASGTYGVQARYFGQVWFDGASLSTLAYAVDCGDAGMMWALTLTITGATANTYVGAGCIEMCGPFGAANAYQCSPA